LLLVALLMLSERWGDALRCFGGWVGVNACGGGRRGVVVMTAVGVDGGWSSKHFTHCAYAVLQFFKVVLQWR